MVSIGKCFAEKSGKYATLALALKALDEIRERDPGAPVRRAYPCNFCRAWHLTKQPKRRGKSPQRRLR